MMFKEENRKKWGKIIKEYETTGLSQAEWCRQKKTNQRTFNNWYRKLKSNNCKKDAKEKWMEVKIKKTIPKQIDFPLIVKIGTAEITVNSDFNADHLLQVVRILTEALC